MLSDNIKYIGVNDRDIDLFEGQFTVPNGMAYNSFVIKDEKIAVLDTVDAKFGEQWLKNLQNELKQQTPNYLVVHHMEPDHSANIALFAKEYPDAIIVATELAFGIMKKFFGTEYENRRIVVKDNDTLYLGKHSLTFYTAPMVHWPEVMMSCENTLGILFSADAFGKFGTLDTYEDWACEARRYYFGIVGKYGMQVQSVLKKLSSLKINTICPLHGPILDSNLSYYIDLYSTWSSYKAESEGVVICYTSVYGNTKAAAELLRDELCRLGAKKVVLNDLARTDMAEAVKDAFKYEKTVLATTTYNSEIFPFMSTFINALIERGYKNRTVGIIENGSWAPVAAKLIRKMLDGSKNLTFAEPTVTVHSALTDKSREDITLLAKALV